MAGQLVGEGRYLPHLVRTRAELEAVLAHVSEHDDFVVDVETTMTGPTTNVVSWVGLSAGRRVYLIPMGHERGVMLTPEYKEKRIPPDEERKVLRNGALSAARKSYTVEATFADAGSQLRPDVVFGVLEPLFFSDRIKIGHNVKFDMESIAKYYGGRIPPGPHADTLVMAHVLDENLKQYDLKTLIMNWLRVSPNPKVREQFYPRLGKKGIDLFPIDEVARYLAKDVWYCWLYYKYLHRQLLRDPQLLKVYEVEMEIYPVIMDMEMKGIRIDTEQLAKRGITLKSEQEEITNRIWDICGESYDVTKTERKRHFLFGPKDQGCQGLRPITFSPKTHQPQANQAVLEHYAPSNLLAQALLEWSEHEKLIGTFIDGLQQRLSDERLHTSFNQHRTVTGRLSSTNPNLHQIPRGPMLRECFIADPGHKLIVADYDQMEVRIAAYLSQDPEMLRIFSESLDIHTEAAAAMLGISVGEVTPEQRSVGKTQNLGSLYGAGPDKVAEVAGVTNQRAKAFIRAYWIQFAGLAKWKNDVIYIAKKSGKPGDAKRVPFAEVPPHGRRRRLPELFNIDQKERARAERQVVNSIVQGYGAFILKEAMRELQSRIVGTSTYLLLNVHDELLVQAPDDQAEDTRDLVVSIMEGVQYNGQPAIGNVPLTVKAGIADNWSGAK